MLKRIYCLALDMRVVCLNNITTSLFLYVFLLNLLLSSQEVKNIHFLSANPNSLLLKALVQVPSPPQSTSLFCF